jgi:hypothetical protein
MHYMPRAVLEPVALAVRIFTPTDVYFRSSESFENYMYSGIVAVRVNSTLMTISVPGIC